MEHANDKDKQPQPPPPNTSAAGPGSPRGALFPHDIPAEHWDVDFSDSRQTYEGSELPLWILAGWAVFILWAAIYLIVGLPTAFR